MSFLPRLAIAAAAVFVLGVGVSWLLAAHGGRGMHNLVFLLAPPALGAVVGFRGWGDRLLGLALLLPLFPVSAIAAEVLAHAVGMCLY